MKVVKVLLWIAVILGVLCGILYLAVFDVYTVPKDDPVLAAAIAPTLGAGDVVLIARHGTADRGYLVRCPDPRPENPGAWVIARVMAKAGEKIDISNDVVSVDARHNPSPYGCDPTTMKHPQTGEDVELVCSTEDTGENKFEAYRAKQRQNPPFKTQVERGKVFLVSDNRHIHLDSRDYGAIDPEACQHITYRLWSGEGFSDAKHRFTVIW
jgi:signal peptidase I